MCRLLFAQPPFERNRLEDLMTFLEGEMGGDGNGVVIFGEKLKLFKGAKVRVSDIVDRVLEHNAPFIFHTRKQSVGPVCDQLCQPFVMNREVVVAHNGTWTGWKDVAEKMLYGGRLERLPLLCNDSLIGARAASLFGPGFLASIVPTGVWMYGERKGEKTDVMAIVRTGNLLVDDDGLVASQFPTTWDRETSMIADGAILRMYPTMEFLQGGLCAKKALPSTIGVKEIGSHGSRTTYVSKWDLCAVCDSLRADHIPPLGQKVQAKGCQGFVSIQ